MMTTIMLINTSIPSNSCHNVCVCARVHMRGCLCVVRTQDLLCKQISSIRYSIINYIITVLYTGSPLWNLKMQKP